VWRRYGENAAVDSLERRHPRVNWPPDKPRPEFKRVVRGRVQYVGSVKGWTNPTYRRLAASLHELDDTYRPRELPPLSRQRNVRLFTEGRSDCLHLLAAKRYFSELGEFTDLEFEISKDSAPGGDAALLDLCKALSKSPQLDPCLFLFDRDNPGVLREAVGPGDAKNWRHGVVSVAVVPPEWRDREQPLCIEMLYEPDVLAREDDDGRRLFLMEEFDSRSGLHKSGPFSTPHPSQKKLVREEVYDSETKRSVALGKIAFAEAVNREQPPFAKISFEGFRRTFEVIQEAVGEAGADIAHRR
jgi:RNA-directed DNA polymerase